MRSTVAQTLLLQRLKRLEEQHLQLLTWSDSAAFQSHDVGREYGDGRVRPGPSRHLRFSAYGQFHSRFTFTPPASAALALPLRLRRDLGGTATTTQAWGATRTNSTLGPASLPFTGFPSFQPRTPRPRHHRQPATAERGGAGRRRRALRRKRRSSSRKESDCGNAESRTVQQMKGARGGAGGAGDCPDGSAYEERREDEKGGSRGHGGQRTPRLPGGRQAEGAHRPRGRRPLEK